MLNCEGDRDQASLPPCSDFRHYFRPYFNLPKIWKTKTLPFSLNRLRNPPTRGRLHSQEYQTPP